MSSLGPFSGATKVSHFGAITGSQDAAERPEGLLVLSTEQAERVRPVALEVPVLVKRHGQEHEVHKVYLSQDELESTAVDIANIVCGDDYWNVSAESDAAPGSKHLQLPGKFTVPYLQELMGGNVTILISAGDPPPVTKLPYDPKTGKHTRAQGPPRGSQKGSRQGRNNVWGGGSIGGRSSGGAADDWSPNKNDGYHDQPPPDVVPVVPARLAYYLDVMHMASEAESTPHALPKHHVHETAATTNNHQTLSTTTFGQLMHYYGMPGTRCNVTTYENGQIKHSLYSTSQGHAISKVASSGTVLVLWDNASRPEDMSTTLWCGESREQGP